MTQDICTICLDPLPKTSSMNVIWSNIKRSLTPTKTKKGSLSSLCCSKPILPKPETDTDIKCMKRKSISNQFSALYHIVAQSLDKDMATYEVCRYLCDILFFTSLVTLVKLDKCVSSPATSKQKETLVQRQT